MTFTDQELQQIEWSLLRHDSVEDCVVLGRKTVESNATVWVAYVVSTGKLDQENLHRYLADNLPSLRRPVLFVTLSRIPVLENGAADHAALMRYPVITPELRERWKQVLRSLPDVENAEVAIEAVGELPEPLQIPSWVATWARRDRAQRPAMDAAQCRKYQPPQRPAVSQGEPLRQEFTTVRTLVDIILRAASEAGDRGILHIRPDGSELRQSYSELLVQARRVLAGLRNAGMSPGDNVILQLGASWEFLPGFWGCVLGGGVPVPVAIAPTYDDANAAVTKLRNAWELLGQPIVIASDDLHAPVSGVARLFDLREFRVEKFTDLMRNEPASDLHSSRPEDIALMMLTSGSAGVPKSVMLSHANLVLRSAAATQSLGYSSGDVSLNWMVLDHVAGLVYFHLRDVYLGCQQIHATTAAVLQEPLKWLDWVDRHRVTITFSPNFGYGLVNDHADQIAKRRWDLSCLKHTHNGGEAIVAKTARRFIHLLEPHGFPPRAMRPAWGMTETCSAVSCSQAFTLDATRDDDPFVPVGRPIAGFSIRIVDDQDRLIEEEDVGRLQVKGPPVTSGYYQNPQLNEASFTKDGWFKTGDLGTLKNGCLTITGREKDEIVVNGINYSSHEIESVVEELEGVEVSYTAACAVREPKAETDRLAVFFHTMRSDLPDRVTLVRQVRRQIMKRIGINASYVIPVEREDIPKTTIGKIQRSKLGQALLDGKFDGILAQLGDGSDADVIPSWFFKKSWQRRQARWLPSANTDRTGNSTVVFSETERFSDEVVQGLIQDNSNVVTVTQGAEFRKFDAGHYQLRPSQVDDYDALLQSLQSDGVSFDSLLHLWTCIPRQELNVDSFVQQQSPGLLSLLCLTQALTRFGSDNRQLSLLVVSRSAQRVQECDIVDCTKAPLLGLVKTVSQEQPWLRCSHLDLPAVQTQRAKDASLVVDELRRLDGNTAEIAIRDGHRWVACLEKVKPELPDAKALPLKQRGAYLITGGLGGIARELARHLLECWDARLLLVGRTPIASSADTDRTRVDALEQLRAVADGNGEVDYDSADVADQGALTGVVRRWEKRLGQPLDGVFHAAGIFAERKIVEETPLTLAESLRPKTIGTLNLHQLVRGRPEALFVTFSSVNGFFGGYGVGAYSAANAFLDNFVHHQRSQAVPHSHCLSWSLWDEIGMSRGYEFKQLSRSKGYYAIDAERGIRSLLIVLAANLDQVLIGLEGSNPHVSRFVAGRTQPASRLMASVRLKSETTPDTLAVPRIVDAFDKPSSCVLRRATAPEEKGDVAVSVHDKVTRELEQLVASVWKDVLKVDVVRPDDNFFDLGGDSLRVAQITKQLGDACGKMVSPTDVFRCPTVRALAQRLSGNDNDTERDEMGRSRGRGEKRRRARSMRRTRNS